MSDKAYRRELKVAQARLDEKLNGPAGEHLSVAEIARVVDTEILDARYRASEDDK